MNKLKKRFTAFFRGRNFSSMVLVALVVSAVVLVNMIMYALTNAFGWYIYTPEEIDLSISSASDELFSDVEDGTKVTVTFCMFEAEVRDHTTGSYVYNTAKQFAERYPDLIELKFANIYTRVYDDAERTPFDPTVYAKGKYELSGEEYDNLILPTSVIFECKQTDGEQLIRHSYQVITDASTSTGFASFSTISNDEGGLTETSYNGEEVFASMVNWVLNDNHGVAYVTTGHGEIADVSLSRALTCAGYYVKTVNLKEESVPSDAQLLVISNPKYDFERGSGVTTEYERLTEYKNRGGNFYVTIDPMADKLPVLEGFLSEFGVSVEMTDGERAIVKDGSKGITTDGFTFVADFADSDKGGAMSALSSEYGSVIVRKLSPISLDGTKGAEGLLYSSSSSVLDRGGSTVDTKGTYPIAAISEQDNRDGSKARLFFSAGIYLTASDNMITEGYSNKNFMYSLFDVFYEKGDMPYGCRSVIYENQILENLTMGTARAFTAVMLAIPALIIVFGAVVLIRRKNR